MKFRSTCTQVPALKMCVFFFYKGHVYSFNLYITEALAFLAVTPETLVKIVFRIG